MDCNTTRRLLDAYVDRELDAAHDLEVAAHLRTCAACAAVRDAAEQRRIALRERLPRFEAPAGLAVRIKAVLPAEASATGKVIPFAERRAHWSAWMSVGLAAALVCAVTGGFAWGQFRAQQNRLFEEAVGDHVRSMQAGHLMDVVSTDQHTVKPWFAGKIDFSPPVVDLAAAGFPLIGGRLDRLDGRTAAALVFRRRQHVINVFVWSEAGGGISNLTKSDTGYSAETWSASGMNFLAISEIPASELSDFVAKYRTAAETRE